MAACPGFNFLLLSSVVCGFTTPEAREGTYSSSKQLLGLEDDATQTHLVVRGWREEN